MRVHLKAPKYGQANFGIVCVWLNRRALGSDSRFPHEVSGERNSYRKASQKSHNLAMTPDGAVTTSPIKIRSNSSEASLQAPSRPEILMMHWLDSNLAPNR